MIWYCIYMVTKKRHTQANKKQVLLILVYSVSQYYVRSIRYFVSFLRWFFENQHSLHLESTEPHPFVRTLYSPLLSMRMWIVLTANERVSERICLLGFFRGCSCRTNTQYLYGLFLWRLIPLPRICRRWNLQKPKIFTALSVSTKAAVQPSMIYITKEICSVTNAGGLVTKLPIFLASRAIRWRMLAVHHDFSLLSHIGKRVRLIYGCDQRW